MIPEMMIDWRLSSWGSWQAMNCCFVVSWKETPGTELRLKNWVNLLFSRSIQTVVPHWNPLNVFLSGRWYQKEKDVVPVEETVVEGEKGSWTKSGASCCKESASTTHRQTPCQNLAKVFAGVALGWNLTQRSVNCAEVAAQKDQHVPGVDFGGDYEQLGRGE